MEAMRQSWTDDRLDALNEKVDRGFEEVDKRFDRVEGDIREFRVEVNARFDSLQRTMMQIGGVVIAALIGVIATQL